jgi:hypothetical protein
VEIIFYKEKKLCRYTITLIKYQSPTTYSLLSFKHDGLTILDLQWKRDFCFVVLFMAVSLPLFSSVLSFISLQAMAACSARLWAQSVFTS